VGRDGLPPRLREGHVEVREVVGVEDDALGVALPVPHPELHRERASHRRASLPATSVAGALPSVRPSPYLPERMFPSRLLRGIDLAIEFATLGEYGLEPVPAAVAPPAFRGDLSGIGGS